MTGRHLLALILAGILFTQCKDEENKPSIPANVHFLTQGENDVWQKTDIVHDRENVTITNLTSTLGFSGDYTSMGKWESRILIFKRNLSPEVFEIDLKSNSSIVVDDFCELNGSILAMASTSKYIFATFVENNSADLLIYRYNKSNQQCEPPLKVGNLNDLNVIWRHNYNSYLVYKEKAVLLTRSEGSSQYALYSIDLDQNKIINSIEIPNQIRITSNQEDLLVFSMDNKYTVYDFDLKKKKEVNFDFSFVSNYWVLFKTEFNGSKMLVDLPMAQPSPISSAPAVVDFVAGPEVNEARNSLLTLLFETLKSGQRILSQDTDLSKNLFVMGVGTPAPENYPNYSSTSIIYATLDGEILEEIETELTPEILFAE